MRLSCFYNEILPKNAAHDAYLIRSCGSLAAEGLTVELVCGRGSWPLERLEAHYQWPRSGLALTTLPILRRNLLGLSWNAVFFFASQRHLVRAAPDWAALSVLKQGVYHLRRRIAGVRYLYEVHELAWYPGSVVDARRSRRLATERDMLARADLVTVTTEALRDILLAPPYDLRTPVRVIPLGVGHAALPAVPPAARLRATYVGQLYAGQGLERLLAALAQARDVELTVIGGKAGEIARLSAQAEQLGIAGRVRFLGFRPPSQLDDLVREADVFVAPFEPAGRMPYVAHTKLLEYAAWRRPVVAPDLPVVREHFADGAGLVAFRPGDTDALAAALSRLQSDRGYLDSAKYAMARQAPLSWGERAARLAAALRELR